MQSVTNLRATLDIKGCRLISTRFAIVLMLLQPPGSFAQTNPAAQSLPYSENFSGLAHTSTSYPAGIQGWQLSTSGSSTSFRTSAPVADLSLNASSSASTTTGTVIHNYNGKIGLLATGSSDPGICLAVNTSNLNSITVSYDVMTIRNPYDGSSNTRINEITLQYRVGTSGSFTSLAGIEYQNNTTTQTGSGVTTPQNTASKSVTLPAGCNNQSVVQIRWVQRDVSGSGSRPSFALDNISISGNASTDIFINADNTAVTENFNNFLGADATTLPTGWTSSASAYNGINQGSNNNGGMYAYGSGGEYALGVLRSGSTGNITITATFRNNTGGTIRNLEIAYDFEQWRYANTSGFTVSTSGAGTGSASALNQNGTASGTNGVVTSTVKSLILTGLNIPHNNTFTIAWTAFDGGGSNNGIAIDNFSIKANVPLNALYYRSAASGSWQSTSVWESSADNSTWTSASYVPASFAATVTIRSRHTIDLNDNLDIDQVVIESGGTLVRKAGVLFTVSNGSGNDITVYGTLKFQSTTSDDYSNAVSYSSGSMVLVKSGGTIEANFSNSSSYWDLAAQSVADGYVQYEDGAIFNWNPTTSTAFATAATTYFPGASLSVKPVFKLSRTISFGVGSVSATTINGIFESAVDITWNGAGTKTFRNGIRGAGTITQGSGCGQFIISGSSAELGGTGTLELSSNGLSIPSGASVTLTGNKTINSGPVSIAGTFDLSDYALSGSYTAFTVSGSAIIKTSHVNGLLSASGALRGTVPSYNFNVAGTTVQYTRLGAQTVTNNDYYNLLFQGSGDKTLAGNTVVNGDISWIDNLGVSVVKCGSHTLEVKGNWDNDGAGDFDYGTGTVYIGQTGNTRSISETNSFNILKIAGTVSLSGTQNIYGRVEVPAGATLNTNGNLVIQSGASLMHGTGTPNGGGAVSGNVTVRRSGSGGAAYNYWSSPVASANVSILGSSLYYYDPSKATDNTTVAGLRAGWVAASGTMTAGVGYISQGGGTVSFTGTAGNAPTGAPITVTVKKNVGASNDVPWNLIGNPFPCGLDADLFIDVNGPLGSDAIGGALYFWDDDNSGGSGWATNDYAVWTKAGAVPGSPIASTNGNSPNGFIASGQSFFVSKTSDGTSTIEFRNTMRSTTNNVFFRQKPIERFWINITNPDNEINETLIAFIDDATDSADLLYDAKKFKGNAFLSVYSKLNGDEYAIQALPPLTYDRVIEVGLDAATPGGHLLRLSHKENMDGTVTLILEDRLLNRFQNLSDNPNYEFHTDAGNGISRFFIHINPALHISTLDESCAGFDGEITITQPGNKTWNYILYDSDEQPVASGNGFSGTQSFFGLKAGLYILELTDPYGFHIAKKITLEGRMRVKAGFTPTASIAPADEPIRFVNSSTGATYYEWDFGDGTIVTGVSEPVHAYREAGKYTVTLKASNCDCAGILSQEITIYKIVSGERSADDVAIRISTIGETLVIHFDNPPGNTAEITVYNAIGQRIYETISIVQGALRVDLSAGRSRYCFVRIKTADKVHAAKVFLITR